MTRPLLYASRALLIAALLPTVFMTIEVFAIGIWFSPLEHPFLFLLVLVVASGPFWVVRALLLSADEDRGGALAVHTVAIWSAIALYLLFVFDLLPRPIYDGWQSLVR